jgi:hypothetical protein
LVQNFIFLIFLIFSLREEKEYMDYGGGERKHQFILNLTTKKVNLSAYRGVPVEYFSPLNWLGK